MKAKVHLKFIIFLLIISFFINSCISGSGGGDETSSVVTDNEESEISNTVTDNNVNPNNYIVIAWNDLGIHCLDKDYSVFSILPPYNVLHAQVIKVGKEPEILDDLSVSVYYKAALDYDGSINTYSDGKINFWDYVQYLFNIQLNPEEGLKGFYTQSLTPHPMDYSPTYGFFQAEGIPTVPYDDNGQFDPYPLAEIIVEDKNGVKIASTKTVIPVSDEMECISCHGSNSGNTEALPQTPENLDDPEKDYRFNILKKHDEENTITADILEKLAAKGYNYKSSLYQTAKEGTPILCSACHKSNALPGSGIDGISSLTSAMHSKHATAVNNSGRTGTDACYLCHPGTKTQCLRGAMGSNGISCQDCHGTMANVGDPNREGWLDMPNCQLCHQQGTRYKTVFKDDIIGGELRDILDNRFATNPDTPIAGTSLYRFSKGHGNLQCSACHGSPHAIYPSRLDKDNQQIENLQGYKGVLRECTVCHGNDVPLTVNGGPHGMHTIGQYWVNAHGEYVEDYGSTSCTYCHGKDYKGTFLSELKTTKTFYTEWGTKTFNAGHEISCYDCHNGPYGD